VKAILADVNIVGYVDLLVAVMQAKPWKFFWDNLKLQYVHFAEVGLAPNSPDSLIWDTCQREELILITNNRNQDAPDSLDAGIKSQNKPESLPVFTIADVAHLRRSRDYVHRVVNQMLDYLMRIEELRGAGRLYLP
jgi:predicted nuclease of predicted toxin-antitoxin system